ncbi:thiol:disulfide interchange protein DsbG [Chromohalobacter sp. 296-RDG]|uniref:thiol:disulfide interchange protein DsbG n=1 Tax=Chromohalobacter sp. 296-RDG TaxID=2994062 RepID=UPI002468C2D2|nr:thiol:disulfide interchange protein DsbG [Chromohalobacter sp. 296-RDG]
MFTMFRGSRLGLVTALSLVTFSAWAQPDDLPAPVEALVDQGLTVHERFDAPDGLTGYAASAQGQPVAIYVTQNGQHAIVGNLVDTEGNNLSSEPLDELVKGPQDDALWQRLEDSHWILDGDRAAQRTVYVFTDPNCPYCKRFWEAARPWVEAGDVQLHHIMIGVLKSDSPAKAATLLGADDPAEAFAAHNRGDEAEPSAQPADIEQQVQDNNTLMRSLGLRGTPAIVYRRDGKLEVAQGMPDEEKMRAVMGSPRP